MIKLITFLWRTLCTVRALFFNLLFIFIVILLIGALSPPVKAPIPSESALWLAPKGTLVEQRTFDPSLGELLGEQSQESETVLKDLTDAIYAATNDPRITNIALNLNFFNGGGITKIEEVGRALTVFKGNNKTITAFADNLDQQGYLLAAYADEIIINPLGSVFLTGFGSYRQYMFEATQKLKVDFHIFKVGTYKDAIEPFIRNSMSEPSKEQNSLWVNTLWTHYTQKVESLRTLKSGAVSDYVTQQHTVFPESGLTTAEFAKKMGLIDSIMPSSALREMLITKYGQGDKPDQPKAVSFKRYLADIRSHDIPAQDTIGLIIADGNILGGNQPAGAIGGRSLSKLIRQAGNNTALKALVIKINSGGGSAFASEQIRQEIANVRSKGLPVYVAMGSVAASGGYWIAAGADKVWAMPTTITGSIGVFGLYPNLTRTFESLGLYTDGVGTTELATTFVPSMPLNDPAKKIFQAGVNDIYKQFLALVAKARGMSTVQVNDIAQGRVWTGQKAYELGLVDALGHVDEAIVAIAKDHNITNYNVKLLEKELTVKEQIMQSIMEQSKAVSLKVRNAWLGEPATQWLRHAQAMPAIQQAQLIAASKNTKQLTVLAHCVECVAP